MKILNIMFDDLTEEAQQRFLEFAGIECAEEGNYDLFPIAYANISEPDDERHWP